MSVLAAANGKAGAILAANDSNTAQKVKFSLKNTYSNVSAHIIDKKRTFEKIEFTPDFEMPPYSVLLIEINTDDQNGTKVTHDVQKINFAGLDNNG